MAEQITASELRARKDEFVIIDEGKMMSCQEEKLTIL